MKNLSKLLALAVFCICSAAFAAEVKINGSVFPVKGNSFSKEWNFYTFTDAYKKLNLAETDFGQHAKHKAICGLFSPLELTVTAPSKITSLKAVGRWINYLDRKERNYVIEYSVDKKNWIVIADVKHKGGLKEGISEDITPADNNGTIYIRFRKNLQPEDHAVRVRWAVILKHAKVSIKF